MRGLRLYKLIDGELNIDNTHLCFTYSIQKYFKEFMKILGGIALMGSFLRKINNYDNIYGIYENIIFWIFAVGSSIIVYLLIEHIFKKIWSNKIELNDLVKIEIDNYEDEIDIDEDSKIEITLFKNNGRSKLVQLKKQNCSLQSFLDDIKKRNSRIIIKHLD